MAEERNRLVIFFKFSENYTGTVRDASMIRVLCLLEKSSVEMLTATNMENLFVFVVNEECNVLECVEKLDDIF